MRNAPPTKSEPDPNGRMLRFEPESRLNVKATMFMSRYRPPKVGFVYIMGSPSGTLYTGVTSNLEARVWQHKHHVADGFTAKHGVTKLLFYEDCGRIDDAIGYEKQIKGWTREKKLNLIRTMNPRWRDLAWDWFDDGREGT